VPDRLQYTFNQDGVIEVMLAMGGQVRALHINPDGMPWNSDAFQEPDVRAALFQYMIRTDAEGWIGWPELEGVLNASLVDIGALTARYPASRSR
jgi:hypothetical protein